LKKEVISMKKILVLVNIHTTPDKEEQYVYDTLFHKKEGKIGYYIGVINYPDDFPKIIMWGTFGVQKATDI
jgi:hypothetical protein